MAFFTQSEARAAAKRAQGNRSIKAVINESMESYRAATSFDIFLSHSSSDAELVVGIKVLLEESGKRVYVDWVDDPEFDRSNVTKATAARLRHRMMQSDSLLYVATDNATNSKWMPWELGYFDGLKRDKVRISHLASNGAAPLAKVPASSIATALARAAAAPDSFDSRRARHWGDV